MDPIDVLMDEHRLIEQSLDALESFTADVVSGASDDKAELMRFVEFIRQFADKRHHGKEEDILFVAMNENGFPRDTGPVGVMLHEHDEGRAYVRALADLGGQDAAWSDSDRKKIDNAARGFGELLRRHIQKEDQILYPMAQAQLPPEVLAQVAEKVARFEEESKASGEVLRQLGAELAAAHPGS